MKTFILIATLITVTCSHLVFSADCFANYTTNFADADTTKNTKKIKAKPTSNFIAAIQNCTNTTGGNISKTEFLNLIKQPLCAKDSKTNTQANITSFDINYCERSVSEDSTGLPIIVTDCNMDPVKGGAFPAKWLKLFEERLYKGDVIKLEDIRVRNSTGQFLCRNTLVITITE